ncbi:LytR/AlgR family response regulator transcription factor [Haliangium sp.]|uniref:LytR/AlgR family response regulator transcription factor n=1 Tax=Haliangium sp. TaxID=2663208 RepID=UPI003D10EE56
MTLSVLIVDDEAPARRKLRRLLEAEPDLVVAGEAADGDEAVAAIRSLAPDIVLLDVQMPKKDGFEVIAAVGVDAVPAVVFVTAYDQHALAAFEVEAVDYLLKPFAGPRLRKALARARTRVTAAPARIEHELERLLARVAERESPAYLTRVLVEAGPNREVLLPVAEIDVLRAQGNYVELVTRERSYRCRGPLSRLEERLDPEAFMRINRSELVRLAAVAELQPWFRGDYRVVLRSGEVLSWSRRYRARRQGEFGPG